MNSIRIGVVGPGLIWSKAHRPALLALGDSVQIAAFAASSERRRPEVAREHPGVPFYLDYCQLIASANVDWVLILTPIALNGPVALAALRAGKHVLLEKPMAHTLAGGEELVRVAAQTGRKLYVLEQSAYPAYIGAIRGVLASGELGEVLTYEYVAHELFDSTPENSAGGYGATDWRIAPEYPLGGLFDGGHHRIARLSSLFGPPDRVYASGHSIRPTYGAFDHVLTLLEYASGLRGTLSHATVLSERHNHTRIRGTLGTLWIDEARNAVIIEDNAGGRRTVQHEVVSDHVAMWRALLAAIVEGREPYYTAQHALQDLRTLFAIDRAIAQNAPVSIAGPW